MWEINISWVVIFPFLVCSLLPAMFVMAWEEANKKYVFADMIKNTRGVFIKRKGSFIRLNSSYKITQ